MSPRRIFAGLLCMLLAQISGCTVSEYKLPVFSVSIELDEPTRLQLIIATIVEASVADKANSSALIGRIARDGRAVYEVKIDKKDRYMAYGSNLIKANILDFSIYSDGPPEHWQRLAKDVSRLLTERGFKVTKNKS